MYTESELLPLSALQHLAFCERQWGLIHLEGIWEENRLTAEGRLMHDRSDEPGTESRGDMLIVRGLLIHSLKYGLSGKADVVEFHLTGKSEKSCPAGTINTDIVLPGRKGRWKPMPVEYKRGRQKADHCDEIQLCAQALCLEEMLGVKIESGALFYGQPRRRTEVSIDEKLRKITIDSIVRLHRLNDEGVTPPAEYSPRCDKCSLVSFCMPRVTDGSRSVASYLASVKRNNTSR